MDTPARYFSRHYVDVITRWRDDGRIVPLSICWEDGRMFQISEIFGQPISNAAPNAPTRTFRYSVLIGRRRTYLYLERSSDPNVPDRWYVEIPQGSAPYKHLMPTP